MLICTSRLLERDDKVNPEIGNCLTFHRLAMSASAWVAVPKSFPRMVMTLTTCPRFVGVATSVTMVVVAVLVVVASSAPGVSECFTRCQKCDSG